MATFQKNQSFRLQDPHQYIKCIRILKNQGKPLFQEWINQWNCFGKFKSNGRYKVRQLRFIRNLIFRQEQHRFFQTFNQRSQISQLTGIINIDHQLPAIRCQCLIPFMVVDFVFLFLSLPFFHLLIGQYLLYATQCFPTALSFFT